METNGKVLGNRAKWYSLLIPQTKSHNLPTFKPSDSRHLLARLVVYRFFHDFRLTGLVVDDRLYSRVRDNMNHIGMKTTDRAMIEKIAEENQKNDPTWKYVVTQFGKFWGVVVFDEDGFEMGVL